jgi:Ca2+/Na+ antiporter
MIRNRKRSFLRNLPLFIALIATFFSVFIIENIVLRETNGVFIYPLDDPFIHMQVAKTLASYNTWGIIPHEFASASSSLLYTLLLTGIFKLVSANVIVPFIINCIAAVFLLAVVHAWLLKQEVKALGRSLILLLLVFLIPLPVLIISGMEHILQCLFSFLFLARFSDWLAQSKNNPGNEKWKIPGSVFVYSILLCFTRYEGLFLVAMACLLLLYFRKWTLSLQLGIAALLPILIFGIYSVNSGSYFLPNSVLIKSESLPFSVKGILDFLNKIFVFKLTMVGTRNSQPGTPPPGISLLSTQRLLIILPLAYLIFRDQLKQKLSYVFFLLILLLGTILHLCFASTGWFYRYEAYLIMCAMTMVSVLVYKYGKIYWQEGSVYNRIFTVILFFALIFPFILRSTAAYSKTKKACINIYQQQYQVARFLKTYYDADTIAANDIGAVSYYTNAKIIDLWGLGSIEVTRSKKEGYWSPQFLDSLVKSKHVKFAIIYEGWFSRELLDHWIKIASWQIHDNVILGGDTVSFYAINKENAEELKQKLQEYQSSLPGAIQVEYRY